MVACRYVCGVPSAPDRWRSPEELIEIGITRSRLVLVNEAHSGMLRCIRTRHIGMRLVVAADRLGVRHLAMEALPSLTAQIANQTRELPEAPGYLGQPEMRELIGCALELGWELIAYEADITRKPREFESLSNEETNWRDAEQAKNLANAFRELPTAATLMVWCGNHHLAKLATDWWLPMGSQLHALAGIEPLSIDQTCSVQFQPSRPRAAMRWVDAFSSPLAAMGGSAGFLAQEAPTDWPELSTADAYLLSVANDLT